MKLISKKIEVGEFKVNATVTREMAEDIRAMTGMFDKLFKYIIQNDYEKEVIEKYFNVEKIYDKLVFYKKSKSIRSIRKIKLLILKNNELSKILEKIINESIVTDRSEILEYDLCEDLSKSIDKEIIKSLFDAGNFNNNNNNFSGFNNNI